ncbi:hypothetical protein A3C26_01755 [Candidatus Daviesbacteria bacterium RIFCSPHIGHO2_02_FULL_39_12]|uniref:Uncharacterized protein n=2 Tax=Candidatus Daviesiibacteriota TaxID=1752718 RepID=A0A1F5JAS6_9BACT|nr:MAG: hypothetical protein A3C26_01755 [Candidatus Daviesbacteria bacterium RIFCSPHIGHO2_02_FULL_39_12]OGE72699.1 MAG: hypothetical protein A3H40_00080 [Candidatus Daviesbacteria bacterium RIFCSPLOWO2_02_FULL_38_15]
MKKEKKKEGLRSMTNVMPWDFIHNQSIIDNESERRLKINKSKIKYVDYIPEKNRMVVKLKRKTITHSDIPVFSFAPLSKIRKDLEKLDYSAEEIDSTIEGLSELPEYEDSKREQKSEK